LEDRFAPAILWVTSNADDNGGQTLRTLIGDATPSDTIRFNLPVGSRTITLTQGEIDIPGKSITIDGVGQANLTIDGGNASRIFNFGDEGSTPTEVVQNLTLAHGSAISRGGAIWSWGTLTVNNVTFSSNQAATTGGAISSVGTLTVTTCTFLNNTAGTMGGAIYDEPEAAGNPLTVTGSTFRSNVANGANPTGKGGAICVFAGVDANSNDVGADVALINSNFTSNQSVGAGGAVFATGLGTNLLRVTDCGFTSNSVTGSGPNRWYWGGAIYTTDRLWVRRVSGQSTFSSNTTRDGGGAIAYTPETAVSPGASAMIVSNTTFQNNEGEQGGALFSSITTSQNSISVSVNGCLFYGNQATGPTADSLNIYGGGMYVYQNTSGTGSASLTITNSTFFQNTSDNYGGGLALVLTNADTGTNTATLTSLTVNANAAIWAGGGMSITLTGAQQARPVVRNSIIAGNYLGLGTADDGPDVFGLVTTGGYNLIGKTDGSAGWLEGQGDRLGTNANPRDPGLETQLSQPEDQNLPKVLKLAAQSQAYHWGDPTLVDLDPTDPRRYDQRG
jgi:predicted outer membrane repeat protein